MTAGQEFERALYAVSAAIFAASAAATLLWCASMSGMGGMPMPGGWTMSMAWMLMPEQSRFGAAASFLGMWIVMMAAMMLPSLVPMLRRYRNALGPIGQARAGRLTALVAAGYFSVWTAAGIAAYVVGFEVARLTMQHQLLSQSVPMAVGLAVLGAGWLQRTAWKLRYLECCREAPGRGARLAADATTAWRYGLGLGLDCARSCGNLMAIVLVGGVMDVRLMGVVTAAITVERLAPAAGHTPRAIGAVVISAGLFLIAQAAGLG